MLVYFSARGYTSIHEPIELNLVPPDHARIKGTRYEKGFHVTDRYKLMRSALLFGPNGSGKTNILKALQMAQRCILSGLGSIIADQEEADGPAGFRMMILDGTGRNEYTYSITHEHHRVQEETFSINGATIYYFDGAQLTWYGNHSGPAVVPERDILSQVAPVLSAATGLRQAVSGLRFIMEEDILQWQIFPFTISKEETEYWRIQNKAIVSLLQIVDPAITGVSFSLHETQLYEVMVHRRQIPAVQSVSSESAGIRKMAALASCFAHAFSEGDTVFVDQLDTWWTTPVLQNLFRQFIHNQENQGQLVGTTHDLLLLDNQLFQPEQLFLVRRDPVRGTQVWSVGDYHLRSEKRRLYDAYLNGLFDECPC
jgi:hypothetical protein